MDYSPYGNNNYYANSIGLSESDKKETSKTFSRLFLSLSVYIIISYLVVYIAQFATILILGTKKASELFSNSYYIFGLQVLSMYIISFPLFVLMTKGLKRSGRYSVGVDAYGNRCFVTEDEKEGGEITLGEFVALFFVCSAVMTFGALISNFFTEMLSKIVGHPIENATSELISDSPLWLIILIAVIIGPVIEELIFRKVLIDVLGVYGARLAIAVSSVAFGIFHGNFSQALYATLLGFILGYMYTKTHKIIYSILMHILINFFGTVPTLLLSDSIDRLTELGESAVSESEALNYFGDIMNVYGLVIMQYGFAIAGVFVFVYCTKHRLYSIPARSDIEIPLYRTPKVWILNLGVILFLIVSAGQFILSIM